jgi:hypothetical protein
MDTWSDEEERIIRTIAQAECVPRMEAIRRMQRRKRASRFPLFQPRPTGRVCRNPRCSRGDDGGPGSLAHLRADARYCGATCKKAVQRSPKLENQASNPQCLCGSKRGQFSSLVPQAKEMSLQRKQCTYGFRSILAFWPISRPPEARAYERVGGGLQLAYGGE